MDGGGRQRAGVDGAGEAAAVAARVERLRADPGEGSGQSGAEVEDVGWGWGCGASEGWEENGEDGAGCQELVDFTL